MALDDRVGLLPAKPRLRERQQHPLRTNQTLGLLEVCAHARRVDPHPLDQPGQAMQGEVEGDRRIGRDHALDRGVRYVPLMPQGDVLKGGNYRGADQPGEPGEVLGDDRDSACAAWPSYPSGRRRTAR